MQIDNKVLNNDEKIILALRSLYAKFGYTQYKMSKFEEYDLYSNNKDFLVSDSVITFTDTTGKLMALKPDVTLSIIKNSNDEPSTVQKLCYNENVYRVSKGTNSFKEIMQVGIECFGDVDDYSISEVLYLASESLNSISSDYILDISSLDILQACINRITTSKEEVQQIIKCVSEKNFHGIIKFCDDNQLSYKYFDALKSLLEISEPVETALPKVKAIAKEVNALSSYEILEESVKGLKSEKIRIDFSVISDLNYYNGIVFKGFINGVPNSVLSGGQYDKLMRKMKRRSKAIGFAVYLDMLNMFEEIEKYDVDVMILYKENNDVLNNFIDEQIKCGNRVFATKKVNSKIKYKKLVAIEKGEVMTLENNA